MESTLDLQVLTPVDWPLLKAARLDALKDSPHAFMSRYEVEWDMERDGVATVIEAATWIIARETERAIGLARSVVRAPRPRCATSSRSGSIPAAGGEACSGRCCISWPTSSATWESPN